VELSGSEDGSDDLDALASDATKAEELRKKRLRRRKHALREKARKRLAKSDDITERLPTDEEERLFKMKTVESSAVMDALDEGLGGWCFDVVVVVYCRAMTVLIVLRKQATGRTSTLLTWCAF
jgi:hypothetical protein